MQAWQPPMSVLKAEPSPQRAGLLPEDWASSEHALQILKHTAGTGESARRWSQWVSGLGLLGFDGVFHGPHIEDMYGPGDGRETLGVKHEDEGGDSGVGWGGR